MLLVPENVVRVVRQETVHAAVVDAAAGEDKVVAAHEHGAVFGAVIHLGVIDDEAGAVGGVQPDEAAAEEAERAKAEAKAKEEAAAQVGEQAEKKGPGRPKKEE